jgi:hypothetical protein
MNEIRNTIDKFIQRYYDLEIIVSPDARGHMTKSQLNFADMLGNKIGEYIGWLDTNTIPSTEVIQGCFAAITKAYANGFLVEGSNLLRKLDEIRLQNRELTKDLAICMANYKALQNEHERLTKMFDQGQTEDWRKQEENQP